MIKQLAHICLYAREPGVMIDFYENILGLPVAFTIKDDDDNDIGWYFRCGSNTFIEIFEASYAKDAWNDDIEGMGQTGNMRHLCFEVDSVDEAKITLEKKGYEVFDISVGMDGARQGWVIDPEGNWIELMEYIPGSKQVTD